MGVPREFMGVLFSILYLYITIKVILPIVKAVPLGYENQHERMVKPPRFPYDGPFGFYSSGLLCKFDSTPYIGGWFGRSCAGPIAPFIQPTPPSTMPTTTTTTTTESPTQAMTPYYSPQQFEWLQMVMNYNGYGNNYGNNYQPTQNGYGAQYPHQNQNPYDDYGEEIEGDPWEPDHDDIFIESYGQSASKPGFKLGDPNQHK